MDFLAGLLRKRHPTWVHVDDASKLKSSLHGSFYLSPRRHVVEHFLFSLLFSLGFWSTYWHAMHPEGELVAFLANQLPHVHAHGTDPVFLALLVFSLGLVVIHKYLRGGGGIFFLLQPCHISAVTLISILLAPPRAEWAHVAFNILLCAMWGSWMAILFPDLRDYKLPLEIENFWLEHALIVALPIWFIWTGRFLVFPHSIAFTSSAFLFNGAFHALVLHTVSLLSGYNLNYQLQPPPVRIVEKMGKSYKWIMYSFTYLVTLGVRYGIVEGVLWASGRQSIYKK